MHVEEDALLWHFRYNEAWYIKEGEEAEQEAKEAEEADQAKESEEAGEAEMEELRCLALSLPELSPFEKTGWP
jgi:uncharacterized membrane protein YqiK